MAQGEATQSLASGTVGTPQPHISQGEQVARILRGESATPEPQVGKPDQADVPAPPAREPLSLKAVAEKLGVDPTDLHRDLKVAVGDGKEISLEEFKDRYKDTTKLDEDRKAVIKLRGELEADRIAQHRELAKLRAATPSERADPNMAQAYERYSAELLSREREAMLRAIPEWSDPAVITAERKQMQDYLHENGGWPVEAIDQIEDHRLFVTLRTAVKDRAELLTLRAEKAKAEQPRQKVGIEPRRGGDQTHGQRVGVLKAAVTKGQLSQTAAVERLLTGK